MAHWGLLREKKKEIDTFRMQKRTQTVANHIIIITAIIIIIIVIIIIIIIINV
jgi:hypothetical protein